MKIRGFLCGSGADTLLKRLALAGLLVFLCGPLRATVLAQYTFNGNGNDSSGNAYNLSGHGTTTFPSGNCDGTSSQYYGPSSDSNYYTAPAGFLTAFSGLSTWSMTFWAYSLSQTNSPVIASWTTTGGTQNWIQIQSGAGVTANINGTEKAGVGTVVPNNTCEFYTVNVSGGTCKVYQNGVLATSFATTGPNGTIKDFYVGRWDDGGSFSFNGYIEDLNISSTVYNTPTPGSTATQTATITPTPTSVCTSTVIRVACGENSSYTDSSGNVWSADYGYSGGNEAYTTTNVTGTSDPTLYKNNRWNNPLTYTFGVPNGTYQVVLLEAEVYFTSAGQRVFNIAINGNTVQTNYDIFAAAGGDYKATSLTYNVTVGTGQIQIVGTASVNNAQFCGIQIIQTNACTSPTPTPTNAGGGFPTATPTITVTPTNTPLPTVYQGLPTAMEPYGLEYVPFPTVTTSGNYQFYPLNMTFSANTGTITGKTNPTVWGAPCNTARWHIVFQGLSSTVGAVSGAIANDLTISVETRIGLYGIGCNTGVYDASAYAAATSLSLPNRPQNISTAYFWVGVTSTVVPYTERFDAVGDPRFVPYADELDYTGATNDGLNGGYNWFWRNFTSSETANTYIDQAQDTYYTNFIPNASFDEYGGSSSGGTYALHSASNQGNQNIDVPKLFKLIRTGVMVSNNIYTAMCGWDSFYAGEGGEIGGDNSNDFQNGVPLVGGPWGSSTSPYNVDEIKGVGSGSTSNNGASYVVTGTSSSNIGWMSMPFLGELWPDGLYASNWSSGQAASNGGNTTWGNLTNLKSTGSTGVSGVAYRTNLQNIPSTSSPYYQTVYHRTNGIGCSTLLDGTNDGTTQFNHTGGTEPAAPVDNDGVQASLDYNISLPSTFAVARTWSLTLGNSAPEWSMQPYSGTRTDIETYSACTYTTDPSTAPNGWGFYASENYPASSVYKNSAAIRVVDLSNALSSQSVSGDPVGGWFIVNALAPSTQTGINFVAQFAILACLRTLADAGVPTAAATATGGSFTNNHNTYNNSSNPGAATGQTYRIPPVPLVTIAHPNNSDQVKGQTTISVQWDVRYARWDGNLYDENYPCIDANVGPCSSSNLIPNPAVEWHDTQPIAFNIIYNEPASVSPTAWYSALTGRIVPAGYSNNYVAGGAGNYISGTADAIFPGGAYQTSLYQYTYPWSNVAAASYKLQVECFRLPSEGSPVAYPHYGYHQVLVDTVP